MSLALFCANTFCSRPLLPTRCWFVWCWCVSTLEQRSWRRCMGRLKTGPSRRHRIQPAEGPILDPRAKETCLKKGQKVDPLEIKSGPPWRSSFGPFLTPSLWQICWGVYFKLKLIWPATAAAGILNWGGPFLRACFFLRFEDPKKGPFFVILFCSNFHSLEALEACLHGLATLEFKTFIEACLQLCFIL